MLRLMTLLSILYLLPSLAFAHADASGLSGGFASGFMHPILGWDHVAAMVAVGLWGVFLGRPAIWVLPIAFPLIMAVGGVLGLAGVAIPSVETGIAASALVLGLLVLLGVRLPLVVAIVIVSFFAIFHGHAHGTELPDSANPLAYSLGFIIATGLLHLAGILFGELKRWPWGDMAVRSGGAVIALAGIGFLTGML